MNNNAQPVEMNAAPAFLLAVRDSAGEKARFTLQHQEITTVDQARALTQGEFPGGTVLCLVPVIKES